MVESLGDYAATCAVAGERYTVRHMNRGIFAEGLGSRTVVRVAALILALYGLSPKFGALIVAMPRPVLGLAAAPDAEAPAAD
jgi:xanthine/uracil permease